MAGPARSSLAGRPARSSLAGRALRAGRACGRADGRGDARSARGAPALFVTDGTEAGPRERAFGRAGRRGAFAAPAAGVPGAPWPGARSALGLGGERVRVPAMPVAKWPLCCKAAPGRIGDLPLPLESGLPAALPEAPLRGQRLPVALAFALLFLIRLGLFLCGKGVG